MLIKKRQYYHLILILIGTLLMGIGSHSTDSDWLLKPPGHRPFDDPATIIPATYHYTNQKLKLPRYRSSAGAPLVGWKKEFVKTRRFASDQSAWIYYRPSDLKRTQLIMNTGIPDSLRIWPVGTTLILEGYKGDALHSGDAKLVEIELMTKQVPASGSASDSFFAVDWNYARFTPEGDWSLSSQKLNECHQCHSIAFWLTGDLVFTPFR